MSTVEGAYWQRFAAIPDKFLARRFASATSALGISEGTVALLVAVLGGGFIGILYWVFLLLVGPSEPLRISILYRFGDNDYLPLIYALARGEYREFSDFATYGRGFLPFPMVSIAPYSIGVALAGDPGFIMADFVVGAARALVLQRTLLLLSRRPLASAFMALVLVVVLYDVHAWSYRIPRPFVTQVFYLLAFHLSLRLWLTRASDRWLWPAAHGVLIAATVQGDLHGGVFLGVAAALTLVATAWRNENILSVTRYGLVLGVGFALTVAPFVVQASLAPADVLVRWGTFDHSRAWEQPLIETIALPLALSIAVIPLFFRRTEQFGEQVAAAAVGLLFVLAALLASSVFIGVLGRAIQIYQFYEKIPQVAAFALAITIALVLLQRIASPTLLAIVMAATTLATLQPIAGGAKGTAQRTSQQVVEAGIPIITHTRTTYRADIAGVWLHLARSAKPGLRVLGTFDQQLAMLWSMDGDHSLLVPDTFQTMVGDAVIEERTLALARLIGMTDAQLRMNLDGPAGFKYFQVRFLTHARWQASPFQLPADPMRYNKDQLARIVKGAKGDNATYWTLEMPEDEKQRISAKYAVTVLQPRPDFIVVNTTGLSQNLPGPSAPNYRQTYSNRSFRVFARTTQGP